MHNTRRIALPAKPEAELDQDIREGFPPPASEEEIAALDQEIDEYPGDPNDGQESLEDAVKRWTS